MTLPKRIFDIALAIVVGVLLLPLLVLVMLVYLVLEGRPVFYVSDRMATAERVFRLIKFRTMHVVQGKQNTGVSGGDKGGRVTGFGRFLRRTRLDELPQLWNVFRGDMSFVGPRPPLPEYVMRHPDIYHQVLKSRPGITGLATIVYHRHEERMLGACHTATETDEVYSRRCIPAKARLDLIYQKHRSFCFDLWLMMRTVGKAFSNLGGKRS